MEAWQVLLLAFFVLLPVVLMLDFWGDERLTARGGPVLRPWPRGRHGGELDRHAAHGAEPGDVPDDTAPAESTPPHAAESAPPQPAESAPPQPAESGAPARDADAGDRRTDRHG